MLKKYIKLKEISSLQDLYNQYIQEFTSRKDDINIEFKFDFEGLSEAENLGYSCYINQMQIRLINDWKGIIKYLKSIHNTVGKITIFRYEFFSDKEYKKHIFKQGLKIGLQIVGFIIFMIIMTKIVIPK